MPGKAWTSGDFPFLGADTPTTDICEIPRSSWPGWAQGSTQFTGFWVQAEHDTAALIVKLISERMKDTGPVKYNYYLIAGTTDGKYLQSGPYKTTDIDHHSSAPSTALPRESGGV